MLPRALDGNVMIYKFYRLDKKERVSFKTEDSDDIVYEYCNMADDGVLLDNGDLPDKDADLVGCSHGWLALHVSKRSRL